MVGCESDRSLNPSLCAICKGPIGSKSLMLWLEFILNTFLIVADACEGVHHKWEACSSKNNTQAPVHPHIKLSK